MFFTVQRTPQERRSVVAGKTEVRVEPVNWIILPTIQEGRYFNRFGRNYNTENRFICISIRRAGMSWTTYFRSSKWAKFSVFYDKRAKEGKSLLLYLWGWVTDSGIAIVTQIVPPSRPLISPIKISTYRHSGGDLLSYSQRNQLLLEQAGLGLISPAHLVCTIVFK